MLDTLFSDKTENERCDMLARLLSTSKKKRNTIKTETLHSVVNLLQGDEEARQFQDLTEEVQDKWRQEFVIARCGFSREKAAAITPATIKALKPPLPNCYLVWQISRSMFQSYWPKTGLGGEKPAKKPKTGRRLKTHDSTSTTYGQKWSQAQALTRQVNWLWKKHEKAGGESRSSRFCLL